MWQNQRNICSLIGQNDISTGELLVVFLCPIIFFNSDRSLVAEPSQDAHNAKEISTFGLGFCYHGMTPFI